MNGPDRLRLLRAGQRAYSDSGPSPPLFDHRHQTAHETFLHLAPDARLAPHHHQIGQRVAHAVYHAAREHAVSHGEAVRRADDALNAWRAGVSDRRRYPGSGAFGVEQQHPGEVRHHTQTPAHLASEANGALRVGAHHTGFSNGFGHTSDNAHTPGGQAETLEERLERNGRRASREALGGHIHLRAREHLQGTHPSLEHTMRAHGAPEHHTFHDEHGDEMHSLTKLRPE